MGNNPSVPIPTKPNHGPRVVWEHYLNNCIMKADYEIGVEHERTKNLIHRDLARLREAELHFEKSEYVIGLLRIQKYFKIKGDDIDINFHQATMIWQGKSDIDEVDDICIP